MPVFTLKLGAFLEHFVFIPVIPNNIGIDNHWFLRYFDSKIEAVVLNNKSRKFGNLGKFPSAILTARSTPRFNIQVYFYNKFTNLGMG